MKHRSAHTAGGRHVFFNYIKGYMSVVDRLLLLNLTSCPTVYEKQNTWKIYKVHVTSYFYLMTDVEICMYGQNDRSLVAFWVII